MRRWLVWGAAAICLLTSAGFRRTDVAKLQPVELLFLYRDGENIWIETDTGDTGVGSDLNQAVDDLKKTCPGELFVDTADYLVVSRDTVDLIPKLSEIMRPSAEVCETNEKIDPEKAVSYLAAHGPGVSLQWYSVKEQRIPVLKMVGERYYLE